MAGVKQKKYGIKNPAKPSRVAQNPVSIGLAPESPAAAKAASATGGVIADRQAK